MTLLELLEYVNNGLLEGKSVTSIGKELGLNESSIRKRLNKNGYKRIGNKFVLDEGVTSNITEDEVVNPIVRDKNKEVREVLNNTEILAINNVDIDKLNMLLNNIDSLLKLIPNKDNTSNIILRNGDNRTISIRADFGLYTLIKERAKRDNVAISEIINRALEDYLNNYI